MNYKIKGSIILLVFLTFMLFLKNIGSSYTITITESLPLGIYKLYPIKDKIEIGDIVQFSPGEEELEKIYKRGYLPRYATTLLKEVAADYSNRNKIEIKQDDFFKYLYVGDKNYGPILNRDSKGREIRVLSIEELRPQNENEYLLLSQHYKSYDSRYFGLISREKIIKKAKLKIKF